MQPSISKVRISGMIAKLRRYRLRGAGCRVPVTSYLLPDTGYQLPVAGEPETGNRELSAVT